MPDAFHTPEAELQDDIEFATIIIKLRECQSNIDESKANFRRDVNRLITGLLTIGIVACSFLFVGMPKDERMALINQERNVAWTR